MEGGRREAEDGRRHITILTSVSHLPSPVSRLPMPMRLISIQIGTPKVYGVPGSEDPMDRVYTSAIGKEPVAGRVWASQLGLSGDAVADKQGHGGADQAVLAYSSEHYPRWRQEWLREDVGPGSFGENLTVSETGEEAVCLGDRWQVGPVAFEVSKPRTPCNTLSRHHRRPELMATVFANGRSGWYLRIKKEGWIEAGMPVTLVDRPYPQWTVRRVAQVMSNRQDRVEEAALLGQCPALAEDWRHRLARERVWVKS